MWHLLSGNGTKLKENIHFREDERILFIVDRLAKNKGSDRSAVYREAIRYYLAANSHLTDQEKKDLGFEILARE